MIGIRNPTGAAFALRGVGPVGIFQIVGRRLGKVIGFHLRTRIFVAALLHEKAAVAIEDRYIVPVSGDRPFAPQVVRYIDNDLPLRALLAMSAAQGSGNIEFLVEA